MLFSKICGHIASGNCPHCLMFSIIFIRCYAHYPPTQRFGDNSSNKFQRALLLKFGTHYLK